MSYTTQKIKEILLETLPGYKEDAITPEASFTNDLGMDSLDLVDRIMVIEKEFDIKISDQEIDVITTVSNLIELVNIKLISK